MAFTSVQLPAWRRALYWFFEFAFRPATAGFVAVSEGEAAAATRLHVASPDRLFLVHNGIASVPTADLEDGRAKRPRLRKSLGIGSDRIAFLAAGRLSHQKAPAILVRAAETVLSESPSALFLWAGDGELRADIECDIEWEIESQGLQDDFRLLGQRDDLPGLLPAFDAFVMPSRYEGLPYALLEAMSAGLPVIGTGVSGIKDLIEDGRCGYLIQHLSPEYVADAVLRLIDKGPDGRAEMGAAARELVVGRYTIDRMVSETVKVYESVLRIGENEAGPS
jgi:glycosyltransferase involved in cell wall biosynthesis